MKLHRLVTMAILAASAIWLVAPATDEVVFHVDSTLMWDHVLRSLGVEPATLIATRGVH